MTRGRGRHLRLAVVVAVLAGGTGLAACGDDGDDGASDGEVPVEDGTLPLLGTSGRVPQRPALAVKIDATERGRPQSGLAEADLVFEEVVEGGLTRLLAVYQSRDPDTVGPVRSARSTDISLLGDLGRPLFAWSGANPTFAAAVESADLVDVGVDAAPDAYRRADDRPAPYNLYASPEQLRAAAGEEADGPPPQPLFQYHPPDAALTGPDVQPATAYRTTASPLLRTSIAWEWDAGAGMWLRTQDGTPHVDAAGDPIRAANVIVRTTPYRDSGVRDSTGAVVPEAETTGEGDVWLLSGGQAQPGRWHQAREDGPTAYTDGDGAPLRLAPGPTWVEVLPPGTGDVA